MTQKTRAQYDTQIATDLADNSTGDITPADMRGMFTDFTDSILWYDEAQPIDADLTTLSTAFTSASASGPASLAFHEDTDNGTNKVTIIAPALVASDKIATLQDVTGTLYITGGTDVAVADGGTGSSTPADARTALGLAIGTDVQAWASVLDDTTAAFTSAYETKLTNIEALADVTDAGNVDAAGAVMESDYNAHTVLAATSDNSPVALTVGEQTIVGRITGGNITALTATQVRTLLGVAAGAIANVVEDTTPQLGGQLDVNGQALGDGTLELMTFTETASAVNHVNITNAATAGTPTISAAGDDTNITLKLAGKGTGVVKGHRESFAFACSDETTALTTGTAKVTFRFPYAFTITEVRASVTTAPTGAGIIVDINDGGSTIMTTNKLSIDAGEKTSTTASTPAALTDTSFADDAEITIDIDQVGSTIAGAGLKVTIIGYAT